MSANTRINQPLIIGGLGGSGTRVIAEIVRQLGWRLGDDLNSANDNLLFTLLFKRPRWYQRVREEPGQIEAVVTSFNRMMSGYAPTSEDWRVLLPAIRDMIRDGHDHIGPHHGAWLKRIASHLLWPLLRIIKLYGGRPNNTEHWGWKEPNAHVYLESLARHYPHMRYIHVIRHGLDMAFSRNQAQLHNWGPLYGVATAPDGNPAVLARHALDFWTAANTHAINLARQLLGSRFLLINYDELCKNQVPVIRELCAFLGHTCTEGKITSLSSIPRIPHSYERYRRHDLGIFAPEQLKAVRQLGFTVSVSAEPTKTA